MTRATILRRLVCLLACATFTIATPATARKDCKTKGGALAAEYLKPFVANLRRRGKLKTAKFTTIGRCKFSKGPRVDVVQRSVCKWWGNYRFKIRFLKRGKECAGWVSSRYLDLKGKAIAVAPPPPKRPPKPGLPGECGKAGREKSFKYCEILKFTATIHNVKSYVSARDSRHRPSYAELKRLFRIPKGATVSTSQRTTRKAYGYFRIGGTGKRKTFRNYVYKVSYNDNGKKRDGWVHGHFLKGPSSEYPPEPLLSAKPEATRAPAAEPSTPPLPDPLMVKKACAKPDKAGAIEHCPVKPQRLQVTRCDIIAKTATFEDLFALGAGSVVEVDRISATSYRGDVYLRISVPHGGKSLRGWIPQGATTKAASGKLSLAGGPSLRAAAGEQLKDVFGRFSQPVQATDERFGAATTIPRGIPVEVVGQSQRKWGCFGPHYLVEYLDETQGRHRRAWVKNLELLDTTRDIDNRFCLGKAQRSAPAKMQACWKKGEACFLKAMWLEYARCQVADKGWEKTAPAVVSAVSREADRCFQTAGAAPGRCADTVLNAFRSTFRSQRRIR